MLFRKGVQDARGCGTGKETRQVGLAGCECRVYTPCAALGLYLRVTGTQMIDFEEKSGLTLQILLCQCEWGGGG